MGKVADIGWQGCPIPVLPSSRYELKGVGVTTVSSYGREKGIFTFEGALI